ncbi:DNA polymerase IV [Mycoplasmopsis bovis]
MNNKNIIFHIDFDSYFVSAHRSKDHKLKNKPVAVSNGLSRSICSSISYELKNVGIKVGWPRFMIEKKMPDTIFVEPNFDLYYTTSNNIFDYIASNYTANIEVGSIDECWVDVTSISEGKNPVALARKIQEDIKEIFDIPVSIGISYSKWAAKMASDLAKPFGVKFIENNADLESQIWPLNIKKYYGIGEKTADKLVKADVKTIGNLARSSELSPELYMIFRNRLSSFINEARGNGTDKLTYEHNNLKGIGNELTFPLYDFYERSEIYKVIKSLANKISLRAQNRNVVGFTLTIIIRSVSKVWKGKQMKLVEPTNDAERIYKNAIVLFEKLWKEQPIRGVGLRLTNLINEFDHFKQLTIFDTYEERKQETKVNNIINDINKKAGKVILKTGYRVSKEKIKESVQSRYLEDDLGIGK